MTNILTIDKTIKYPNNDQREMREEMREKKHLKYILISIFAIVGARGHETSVLNTNEREIEKSKKSFAA